MSVTGRRRMSTHAARGSGQTLDTADADADLLPGRQHGLLLGAMRPIELTGLEVSGVGEFLEIRRRRRRQKRRVPDVAWRLPRRAADAGGRQVECLVRNARIDVHASVVAAIVV